jgi:excisionase family DNA binding protein
MLAINKPRIATLSEDEARSAQSSTELTTQQAADFLHVSRPYFLKLLDERKINYGKVGVRRGVRLEDLMRYMEESSEAASEALDEMSADNQRLGLYP